MERETTALFIAETPGAHGVYDAPTETTRELYVTVRSVGMRETYEALSTNHKPEIVVVLEHDFEYEGEQTIELNGVRYSVLRTYVNQWDQIEITLERKGNTHALQ